jgi:hypothetical protein
MTLPIREERSSVSLLPRGTLPAALGVDDQQQTDGIPWLRCQLRAAAPAPVGLLLRIYNRAGIPIIEGRAELEAGATEAVFREVRALGIEGYAHRSAAERAQVAERVWQRRAYATLAAEERGDRRA